MRTTISIVALVLCSLPPTAVSAGGCRVVRQRAVLVSNVSFFVGRPLRVQADTEAAKRTDPDYSAFQQFKRFRNEFAAFQQWRAQAVGEATVEAAGATAPSVLTTHCAKCHGGPTPKARLTVDGLHTLTPAQITAAQRKVIAGEMPPDANLDGETIGDILQELLKVEARESIDHQNQDLSPNRSQYP